MIIPKVVDTIMSLDIPQEVMDKAVREAVQIAKENLARFQDKSDINLFCHWDGTPSGHEFWRTIYNARSKRAEVDINGSSTTTTYYRVE